MGHGWGKFSFSFRRYLLYPFPPSSLLCTYPFFCAFLCYYAFACLILCVVMVERVICIVFILFSFSGNSLNMIYQFDMKLLSSPFFFLALTL